MNIVVIHTTQTQLVFGTSETPQCTLGVLKINFVGGKGKKAPNVLEINTIEDFQKACTIIKKTKKSRSKQEKKTINGFLNSGDYNENQVFMVPESWDENGSVDKGYEMARELLKTVGKNKPFNLRFVSRFSREQLLTKVQKENKALVETIPHLNFFDHEVTITPEAFSSTHFRLIRDIVISDSGRLSLIKHEVKNIVEEKLDKEHLGEAAERFMNHTLKILDDLDCTAYTNNYAECKPKLAELQQRVEEVIQKATVDEFKKATVNLQTDILQLINEINLRIPHANPQDNLQYAKQNYRVLIIEDNRDQRKSLYQFFSSHYEFVACNDIKETLSEEEFAQWKAQLEQTFFSSDIEAINAITEIIESLKKTPQALTYDELKPLDAQVDRILQGSRKKVDRYKEKFFKSLENLKNLSTVNQNHLQPVIMALQNIQTELTKSFVTEKQKIRDTIDAITLKDYGPAMGWINNMKEIGSKFHIVILDLLLKAEDNETWLPFNGIDLLCNIRKHIPYNTVRIITSLPRHEVGSILQEEGIVVPLNQIFTKGNGWPQLEGCLYDRLDEINTECHDNEDKRREIEQVFMPDRGEFFTHSEVREYAQLLIANEKFKSVFEKAQDMVNDTNNAASAIPLMGKHGFNPRQVSKLFVNYLAHRFAFLKWAATEASKQTGTILMQGVNFTDYATKAQSYHIFRDVTEKLYYNIIGFHTSGDCFVNINTQALFPLELDYYFKQASSTVQAVGVPEILLKWCVCEIRPKLAKDKTISGNNKFKTFCAALDKPKTVKISDILDWLREWIRTAKQNSIYDEALLGVCQGWYKENMKKILEKIQEAEAANHLSPISLDLEKYIKPTSK